MKKVLTIAGSDSSCGAGLQADIKTFCSLGVYGLSTVTSITSQNSTGVKDIYHVSPKLLKNQLITILNDIKIDAIKIGMIGSKENIMVLIEVLKDINIPIVLDTVFISSSGSKLLDDEAFEIFTKRLIPLATLITPNLLEAEKLTNQKIISLEEMKIAIKKIKAKNIFLKGGHLKSDASDLFYDNKHLTIFNSKRIIFEDIHGTGCVLSSAIATFLAKGYKMEIAIKNAKKYITDAINSSIKIGDGMRYINHSGIKYEN